MRIDERIAGSDEPSFSFEFFPPRTDEGERNLGRALAELSRLHPTFVSVTYGAGGSTRTKTLEIVKRIKDEFGLEAMAHFTCVGATTAELREMLDTMRDAGIDNVLALRGDPPQGQTEWTATEGGLRYSSRISSISSREYVRPPSVAVHSACPRGGSPRRASTLSMPASRIVSSISRSSAVVAPTHVKCAIASMP